MKLRDYQIKDLKSIEEALSSNRGVIYQLPTGGGKSVILSKFIDDYKKENILILAHKNRLLRQLKDYLNELSINVGIKYSGVEENMDSNIIIIGIRSAVQEKRLESILSKKWDKIIIDEARHSRTPSYDKLLDSIFEKNKSCKLLGVDATPYRNDDKRLDKHFSQMVVSNEDTESLIKKGFLSKFKTFISPIGDIDSEVAQNSNDYQPQQLSEYMRKKEFLNYLVDTYNKFGNQKQAIIFAVDIKHSESIKEEFIKRGFEKTELINSTLSQDKVDEIYENYKNGNIQILVNVEMLTEGVDLPETGCIIGARPTKSLPLYLQMVGRGLRLKEKNDDLIILDCSGWTVSFGQVNAPKFWSLNHDQNPNGDFRKKICGRDEHGKIIDDLSEFVGEVVEMTDEEIIEDIRNQKKSAEQVNLSLDEKINLVLEKIVEPFKKELGNAYDFYELTTESQFTKHDKYISFLLKSEVDKCSWSRTYTKMYLNGRYMFEFKDDSDTGIEGRLKISHICGILNGAILHKDVEKKVSKLIDEANGYLSQKTDLNSYDRKEQEFIEKRINEAASEFVTKNEWFELSVSQRHVGKHYLYNRNAIAIKIPAGKININKNIVDVKKEDGEVHSYEMRGEHFMDLLVNGKWKMFNF